MSNKLQYLTASATLTLLFASGPLAAKDNGNDVSEFSFNLVVSAGAKTCIPNAAATVTIRPGESAETMDVTVQGMPPRATFDVFVTQVPKAPFGVAWYQGDIETDRNGRGHATFVGRFSVETFAVAPGSTAAPVVFNGPFPNASLNPPFNPIQMYHLGLWFDSPQAAQAAGCPATVTPFNGEHNAGIQAMNSSNFADDQGPLRNVTQ